MRLKKNMPLNRRLLGLDFLPLGGCGADSGSFSFQDLGLRGLGPTGFFSSCSCDEVLRFLVVRAWDFRPSLGFLFHVGQWL